MTLKSCYEHKESIMMERGERFGGNRNNHHIDRNVMWDRCDILQGGHSEKRGSSQSKKRFNGRNSKTKRRFFTQDSRRPDKSSRAANAVRNILESSRSGVA